MKIDYLRAMWCWDYIYIIWMCSDDLKARIGWGYTHNYRSIYLAIFLFVHVAICITCDDLKTKIYNVVWKKKKIHKYNQKPFRPSEFWMQDHQSFYPSFNSHFIIIMYIYSLISCRDLSRCKYICMDVRNHNIVYNMYVEYIPQFYPFFLLKHRICNIILLFLC